MTWYRRMEYVSMHIPFRRTSFAAGFGACTFCHAIVSQVGVMLDFRRLARIRCCAIRALATSRRHIASTLGLSTLIASYIEPQGLCLQRCIRSCRIPFVLRFLPLAPKVSLLSCFELTSISLRGFACSEWYVVEERPFPLLHVALIYRDL